ncbi:MAG: prenyltransferase/squalene oxidase repeat-containing protein [Planctomycetota bacterium]|jgi:hypothetical protein
MTRCVAISISTMLLAMLLGGPPAAGKEEERSPTPSSAKPKAPATKDAKKGEITKAQLEAVRRGLAWLAHEDRQNADGSWGESTNGNLATTSLVLLALMANGNTEARGRYKEEVLKGVKFILRHVTTAKTAIPGRPVGYIHLKNDELSKMHAHGYATLVLALAYGMESSDDEERRAERRALIQDRLKLAVKLIERAQDESGGWYYDPFPKGHEGSVTVCQIQALRAARDAGIKVNREVVDKALTYLRRSQDPKTGGFCYSLQDRKQQSYALTAAALSTLYGLGEYGEKDMVLRGLDYLERQFEENFSLRRRWFYYGNFYAAQAMYQAAGAPWGEKYWRKWWPGIRKHLVQKQVRVRGDVEMGYWTNRAGHVFDLRETYATAFATLILQVPLEILPIFQR